MVEWFSDQQNSKYSIIQYNHMESFKEYNLLKTKQL